MATPLPKYFVMEYPTGGAYLSPVENPEEANEPSNVLKFVERRIFSPRAKFASEQSKKGSWLVHIRSCYNNKYWVAHETGTPREFVIAASADEPEEDATNPACTLFSHSTGTTDTGRMGFLLESIKWPSLYVCAFDGRPLTLSSGFDGYRIFPVDDLEKIPRLPSQVTFKSQDLGGKYLKAHYLRGRPIYQQFVSGLDINDPLSAYQLFPTSRGYYRIKSVHSGMFLRKDDQTAWMGVDDKEDNNEPNTLFEFVIISGNVMALRNLGNNHFCGAASTGDWPKDCLNAGYQTTSRETKLIVEERVMRREIAIEEYHLPLSRIYNGEALALAVVTIQNRSPRANLEQNIKFSESVETSSYWDKTASGSLAVSTEFVVSAIPFIVDGKVGVSVEGGYKHKWADSKKEASKVETNVRVVASPSTNIKVSLLCTTATCDVPFSYSQNDLFPDGRRVSKVYDDGLYTGVKAYEFHVKYVEVDEHGNELKPPNVEPVTVTFKQINPEK